MLYVNGVGLARWRRLHGVHALRELAARRRDAVLGSIVGADGGVSDAVRRSLYIPMRADQLPDFVLPLNVREQGKRVIYEPTAVLTEEALSESGAEFRMRVRVALRAFWALWDKSALLESVPVRRVLVAALLAQAAPLRQLSYRCCSPRSSTGRCSTGSMLYVVYGGRAGGAGAARARDMVLCRRLPSVRSSPAWLRISCC